MSERTALVVDDSRSARYALRKHLESHAFKVDTAESAKAAYHWLASQTPDLIFLDHVMPGEDGFAALRHLKADPRTAAIPVVICSSNEGKSFVAEARSQGAADVLQKPPTPEQLQRVLAQVEPVLAQPAADAAAAAQAPAAEPAPAPVAAAPPPPAALPAESAAGEAALGAALGGSFGDLTPLQAELEQLRAEGAQTHGALDARLTAMEARMSAMEKRLAADLATLRKHHDQELSALRKQLGQELAALRKHSDIATETLAREQTQRLEALRKQLDGDLRAVHQQFAHELERAVAAAREQAVEQIRETLLRALKA
ncbi:MAG: response regulator [Gammaproteobacteria bacterium]